MKTAAEMREAAKGRVDDLAGSSKKAAYAVMGAPVIAGRRIAGYADKVGKSVQREFEAWVAEGERLSDEIGKAKVVTDFRERVDLDQLQGRVEKLKDQLEDVLNNWRETFKPGEVAEKAADKPKTAKKPAAKSTAKAPAAPKTKKAVDES